MLIYDEQRVGDSGVFAEQVFVATTPVSAVFPGAFSIRTAVSAIFAGGAAIRQLAAATFAGGYSTRQLVSATFSAGYVVTTPSLEAPMSFTPSPTRTVTVQINTPRRPFGAGSFWSMANPRKPKGAKDPSAIIDITFDWTEYLADTGDTIVAVEFALTGGLVQVGKWVTAGTRCTILLSGGNDGETAGVACHITLSSAPVRVDERTVYLDIEQL